jgi:hypothetical protein
MYWTFALTPIRLFPFWENAWTVQTVTTSWILFSLPHVACGRQSFPSGGSAGGRGPLLYQPLETEPTR